MKSHYPIPNLLNLIILAVSTTLAIVLLKLATHAHSLELMLVYAIIFSFINNTNFSLLHEAVHDTLNQNQTLNYCLGVLLAAFFPTGFTLQRCFHLGHHQRNRSEAEQFDYYRSTDNVLLRKIQWYGILTGFYWCLAPLTGFIYLLAPSLLKNITPHEDHFIHSSGGNAMLKGLEKIPRIRARCEILYTILFQLNLFAFWGISIKAWLFCYIAFAINWSSLQYADHAWSTLDPIMGSWNLRTNFLVRYLFLNYHHHRAHHQNPRVSWRYLPSLVNTQEPRPFYFRIYLLMWRGPKPINEHEKMHKKVLETCC